MAPQRSAVIVLQCALCVLHRKPIETLKSDFKKYQMIYKAFLRWLELVFDSCEKEYLVPICEMETPLHNKWQR